MPTKAAGRDAPPSSDVDGLRPSHDKAEIPGAGSCGLRCGAESDGATFACGGGPDEQPGGLFVRPIVVTGVTPHRTIVREEVFGPVLVAYRFRTEAEALALANDTGLDALHEDTEVKSVLVELTGGTRNPFQLG